MAAVTGAVLTYDPATNREDLADFIANVSPTTTPFISNIGETEARDVNHEWSTDSLATVDTTNAQLEGDDITRSTSSTPTRVNNICQISEKDATVSGSQKASNPAGIADMLDYQIIKKGKELKRDMEAILTRNQGLTAGDSTTARTARSLESWLTTNTSFGSGGADATTETAGRTDATTANLRTFTETILDGVVEDVFNSGGEPDILMVGAFNKQQVSDFTGRSSARQNISEMKIQAGADLYASDFGDMRVIPNRFQRGRSAFLLQSDLWAVSYLRRFVTFPLDKVGDADTEVILSEYTLEARNEAGSGGVFDLTTS